MIGTGTDLTKYPFPLIIKRGLGSEPSSGEGALPSPQPLKRRETGMRILIHRADRGVRLATIVPSPASRLPPVQVQGHTKEEFRAELVTVIEELRRLSAKPEVAGR